MPANLHCSEEVERKLYEIRDLLYQTVQSLVAGRIDSARTPAKDAYENLSQLLDRLQRNLKTPDH
jgi:hypothetical protein